MKTFSVSWNDPNNMNKWQGETLYTLSAAKKLMKQKIAEGMNNVSGSITKIWANGDWENCGAIQLTGRNTTFVTNTRQQARSYA